MTPREVLREPYVCLLLDLEWRLLERASEARRFEVWECPHGTTRVPVPQYDRLSRSVADNIDAAVTGCAAGH